MSILKPVYKAYEWYISRNLTPENMPKHVAIIMDGNRRFSKILRSGPATCKSGLPARRHKHEATPSSSPHEHAAKRLLPRHSDGRWRGRRPPVKWRLLCRQDHRPFRRACGKLPALARFGR